MKILIKGIFFQSEVGLVLACLPISGNSLVVTEGIMNYSFDAILSQNGTESYTGSMRDSLGDSVITEATLQPSSRLSFVKRYKHESVNPASIRYEFSWNGEFFVGQYSYTHAGQTISGRANCIAIPVSDRFFQ